MSGSPLPDTQASNSLLAAARRAALDGLDLGGRCREDVCKYMYTHICTGI